jgi:hypothetical protein
MMPVWEGQARPVGKICGRRSRHDMHSASAPLTRRIHKRPPVMRSVTSTGPADLRRGTLNRIDGVSEFQRWLPFRFVSI